MSNASKNKFPHISADIRDRQTHSRSVLRKDIRETTGKNRWYAWEEKRSYGSETRHLLLAYALIRGLPYEVCEKKCEGKPSASYISNAAAKHGYAISVDTIRAWLEGNPVPKVEKAAPEFEKYVVPVTPAPQGFFRNLLARIS